MLSGRGGGQSLNGWHSRSVVQNNAISLLGVLFLNWSVIGGWWRGMISRRPCQRKLMKTDFYFQNVGNLKHVHTSPNSFFKKYLEKSCLPDQTNFSDNTLQFEGFFHAIYILHLIDTTIVNTWLKTWPLYPKVIWSRSQQMHEVPSLCPKRNCTQGVQAQARMS